MRGNTNLDRFPHFLFLTTGNRNRGVGSLRQNVKSRELGEKSDVDYKASGWRLGHVGGGTTPEPPSIGIR